MTLRTAESFLSPNLVEVLQKPLCFSRIMKYKVVKLSGLWKLPCEGESPPYSPPPPATLSSDGCGVPPPHLFCRYCPGISGAARPEGTGPCPRQNRSRKSPCNPATTGCRLWVGSPMEYPEQHNGISISQLRSCSAKTDKNQSFLGIFAG